jgi:mannosyltransferase
MEIPAPLELAARAERNKDTFLSRHGISILLVLITIAATLLRFHAIANRGFWLDETFSATISQDAFSRPFRINGESGIYMLLYFVLLHFWMALGDSEFVIRSLSVVCSVATVPFTYALGSRLFGRKAGLIAAGLLALNAFHIRYAQEARTYALVTLLSTISTWLLIRNLQERQRASWTLYGVFLALMTYSHFLALLIVFAHCVAIACLPPHTIPWKGLRRSTVWFVCLTLPMAVMVLLTAMKTPPASWTTTPDWSTVLHFFVLTAGNSGILLLVLDSAVIAALIFDAGHMWWRNGSSTENWPRVFVLLGFFLPVAIVLAVSEFHPLFVPRYLLPCLPAFLLAVSAGLMCIPSRSVAWTLGGAIFLLSLAAIPSCYDSRAFFFVEDWRAISSGIVDQAKPGDGISFYPQYAQVPFEYYRARNKPVPGWPAAIIVDPGKQDDATNRPSTFMARSDKSDLLTSRLWVVFYHPVPLSGEWRKNLRTNVTSWRTKGWPLLQAQEFPNVVVMLFGTSSAAAASPEKLPNLFETVTVASDINGVRGSNPTAASQEPDHSR